MWAFVGVALFVIAYNFLENLQNVCRLKRWQKRYNNYARGAYHDKRVIENRNLCDDLFEKAGLDRKNAISNDRFSEAIGVYKHRMIESINPIVWMRVIIFLPRYVMDYIGIEPGKKSLRVIHVIGWIIEILCAVFLEKVFERMVEQIIR